MSRQRCSYRRRASRWRLKASGGGGGDGDCDGDGDGGPLCVVGSGSLRCLPAVAWPSCRTPRLGTSTRR